MGCPRIAAAFAAAFLALPLAAPPLAAEPAPPAATPTPPAKLLIEIDKSTQQMTVSQDGELLYQWAVSTGRARYNTPSGSFKPFRMDIDHYSKRYDNAPMPHSIFFTRSGDAIHGTYEERWLGNAVSHGCVRLSRRHAAVLWALVKHAKMANTEVVLSGHIPATPAVARSATPREDDVTGTVPRYQRRWANDDTFYDDGPPAYVPRRYHRSRNRPPPFPFPFFFFGR